MAASTPGLVKSVLLVLFQGVCLLAVAVGSLAILFAGFFVCAMMIAWFQDGSLQVDDKQMLAKALVCLASSIMLVAAAGWLRCRAGGNKRDDTFRLVLSASGRSEKLVQEVSVIIFLVVLAIWLGALTFGGLATRIPITCGWLVVGFMGMHARILFHELGHFVAARLLNFRPQKIQVGVGPLLWSRSLANGILCEWRLSPQGGFVLASRRTTKAFRTRQSLFIIAGPLADMVIVWSTYQVIGHTFGSLSAAFVQGPGGLLLAALFWWTAISAVGGLIPHKTWLGENQVWTDGYWLLRIWTSPKARLAELSFNPDWVPALRLLQSERPDVGMSLEIIDSKQDYHGGLQTFQQQQARLASSLLREVKPEATG